MQLQNQVASFRVIQPQHIITTKLSSLLCETGLKTLYNSFYLVVVVVVVVVLVTIMVVVVVVMVVLVLEVVVVV